MMKHIESILNFRRYLKRRNLSVQTDRNYLHRIQKFMAWVAVPVESVTSQNVKCYIDCLLEKRLSPQTINSHLVAIRRFYNYLKEEESLQISNPVIKKLALRLPKPLPRHLRDSDVGIFLRSIKKPRDMAMFMLMLRCGLRVEEVANLTLGAIDYRRSQVMVMSGKGAKDRVVYLSNDAAETLAVYLQIRPVTKEQRVFLVEKGNYKGKSISIRGIQKRVEYYSKKSAVSVSCHQLRHTMATQLLNADADLVTIQDLLGHSRIKTTQRYCKLSNVKAQRDYYNAMAIVLEKTTSIGCQIRRH